MYPELFHIGPLTIHTYGLLVATGFLTGIWWMARLAKQEGIDAQAAMDTAFWIVVAAIIGSRAAYVLINGRYFLGHPLEVFYIWSGGLVFYGGMIGAVAAGWYFVRRYKLEFNRFADAAAPGVALGHAIGRLGCLAAGCCYGVPTQVPWAVTFTDAKSIAPTGVPLHPTQLYDAANEFVIFLILMALWPRRAFKGQIWWTWVALYAVGRSIVEMYRGDPRGGFFGGALSTSQTVAVAVVALSAYFYLQGLRSLRAR